MSVWIILSWVFVLILTAINVVIFMKLKSASEQMMKMAFPNAKNMGDAVAQMQKMMGGMGGMPNMGGMGGMPRGGFGGAPARGGQNMDAQLKQAMEMLRKAQKK
ncbi:MAG: hypothetical protein ACJ763_17035 [Bdellovibrionia bacterium]